MAKNKKEKSESSPPQPLPSIEADGSPFVFISHDTRDADLAEAFANLLTDASGGILKSFRSSDKTGTAGIEFGTEWYAAIMEKLDTATDVVALLTVRSLNRPWILYETGVAKGKLNSTVFGLAVGVSLEKAATGPFAQFQNCGDDEDSLTKLVLQLIRRHPDAAPREEAVKRQVRAFREDITKLLKSRPQEPAAMSEKTDVSVAKLFEEIKLQIRDLPEILRAVRELELRGRSSEQPVDKQLQPVAGPEPVGLRRNARRSLRLKPALPVNAVVNGKPVLLKFANTWKQYLQTYGWPNDRSKFDEVVAEVARWFEQDPSRLRTEGVIAIRAGTGRVTPESDGVLLSKFEASSSGKP